MYYKSLPRIDLILDLVGRLLHQLENALAFVLTDVMPSEDTIRNHDSLVVVAEET